MKTLNDIRTQAQNQFEQLGFPTTQLEDWRYTDVAPLEKAGLSIVNTKTTLNSADLEKWILLDCDYLIFVDGFFEPTLSKMPEQINVCSINEALKNPSTLEKFNQIEKNAHGFIEFNTAHFVDGAFIYVSNNAILEKPLQLVHIATQNAIFPTRNLVILDENAQMSLIEMFVSQTQDSYQTNHVTEIFIGENADLTLYGVQQENDNAAHFNGVYVEQASHGRFTHHHFALGSLLARNEIISDLATAAECELNGLYLGANHQHLDNFTRINHNQPHGISREFYKGILNDSARGVFQGRIVVAENAQKIDSQMNNRNLLLSNKAEIDTKPQLEIYADDVKCSHGVTVGQLAEQSIFYLQSRGIDKETAKHILTFAFANEMAEKITFEPLKAFLKLQITSAFG